jgi:hypothetical protein
MPQEREGSVVAAFGWMLVPSIILGIFLPTIGPFIAGLVGGMRAGSVKNALLAARAARHSGRGRGGFIVDITRWIADYRPHLRLFGRGRHYTEHRGTSGWSLDRRIGIRMKWPRVRVGAADVSFCDTKGNNSLGVRRQQSTLL